METVISRMQSFQYRRLHARPKASGAKPAVAFPPMAHSPRALLKTASPVLLQHGFVILPAAAIGYI